MSYFARSCWSLLFLSSGLFLCHCKKETTHPKKVKSTRAKPLTAKKTYTAKPSTAKKTYTTKHWNSKAKLLNVKAFVASLKAYSNRCKIPSSLEGLTFCGFKSKKYIRKDRSGKWFFRFSLHMTSYNDSSKARLHFGRIWSRYQKRNPMSGKGDVSRYLLANKSIYGLSTGCFSHRRLRKVWTQLQVKVLGSLKPEKGTVIRSECGGSVTLQ